jgi:predicted DCC family thiol-disulfide oxidoreductase YuxK
MLTVRAGQLPVTEGWSDMTRYLLFDAQCLACESAAKAAERAAGGRLTAVSLNDPRMGELLTSARPGWKREPTLLEVGEGTPVRVYTGSRLAVRLVRLLGPRRASQVLAAVGRSTAEIKAGHTGVSRRQALVGAGGIVGAVIAGAAIAKVSSAHGGYERHAALTDSVEHSAAVRQAIASFGQADWAHAQQFGLGGSATGYVIPLASAGTALALVRGGSSEQGVVLRSAAHGNGGELRLYTPRGTLASTLLVSKDGVTAQPVLTAYDDPDVPLITKACFLSCIYRVDERCYEICKVAAETGDPWTSAVCVACAGTSVARCLWDCRNS